LRRWLKDKLDEAGARDDVMVCRTGCLGVCSARGVTVAVVAGGRQHVVVASPVADRGEVWEQVVAVLERDLG